MGPSGFLKQARPSARTVFLADLAGATVGVCGHYWLHSIGCHYAADVAAGDYTGLTHALLGRVAALRQCGLGIIISFDAEARA